MVLTRSEEAFCLQIQGDHNETLEILNSQRRAKLLCDVVLVVDGEEFSAHRGVLAANSKFFLALFTTEMLEKDKRRAKLSNISGEAMNSILEFMYTGQIQINTENVFHLLEASNFLFVGKVRDACCAFLERMIDLENCLAVLSIAEFFSCESLRAMATRYIHREFVAIAKTDSFMKLDEKKVEELLSSDDIRIENEEQLLEILIDWIKFDLEKRRHCLNHLLKYIRLPSIHQSLLESKLYFEKLHEPQLLDRSTEVFKFSSAGVGEINPRKSCRAVEVIVVSGGCDDSAILNSTCCYIPAVKKWAELSSMNIPRWRLQLIKKEDNLFAVGGLRDVCTRDPVIPFAERFNGRNNSWEPIKHELTVSNIELDSFSAILLGDRVLLTGGLDPQSNICSSRVSAVELGDESSSVADLAPMTLPRAGHCLVTSGESVYAIGGFQIPFTNSPEGNRSVERYDVGKDTWTPVQPMNQGRQYAAAVFMNNKIYIFGGFDGQNVLQSCEVYDIEADTWQQITPMKGSRMKHSAVVHGGTVYVVGGVSENNTGTVLNSVECYIPEEDRWTSVTDMPTGRFDHHCSIFNVGYKFLASVIENSP